MSAALQSLKPWLTAARPLGHGMIAMPMLWGQALAFFQHQTFSWGWFVITQLLAVLIQIHSLYLNDYADEHCDRNNQDYWLSGGSRVIPEGRLSGQQLYRASFVAAILLLLISVAGAFYGRPYLPLFALLALFASATYSLAPLKSSYRGVGEIHQGLSCGIGLPLWAYYLQTGTLDGFAWWFLLPLFLIFFASNIITALPDIASDAAGGKRSYPVRFGESRARSHTLLVSLLAALIQLYWLLPSADYYVIAGLAAPAGLFAAMWLSGMTKEPQRRKQFMLLSLLGHLWLMVSCSLYFAFGT